MSADAPDDGRHTPSMQDLLTLLPDGPDTFQSQYVQPNPGGTIFGGVLIGQVLAAASQSLAEDLQVHHLHLSFLATGQVDGATLRYRVSTLRVGRSFTTRQVSAWQGERQVVSAEVSFQHPEVGPTYQIGPRHVAPDPLTLPNLRDLALQLQAKMGKAALRLITPGAAEVRMVDAEEVLLQPTPVATLRYWLRLGDPLPALPWLHAAALGYLSDFWFPLTALLPHLAAKLGHGLHVTSLNHTIWWHRAPRCDDWLWVETESPGSGGARGLSFGRVYDREGQLIASLAQENLFRGWQRNEEGALVPPRQARMPKT